MRLLKSQNTNSRNIKGSGLKVDPSQQQVSLDVSGSLIIPKGPTSLRPLRAAAGSARYNTDTLKFEYFEGNEWTNAIDIADNVFYVTKNGSDSNNGKTIGSGFSSIKYALSKVPEGATLHIKAGDYTLENPVIVPKDVGIIGDSLRTVIIRSASPKVDMFWVNNGSYLAGITFKDHEAPAAVVAFNPDGSAGQIFKSPYVQNCTSITTTGTGMRVDGAHATGLKSMVVDAFTQYNQGGTGIHMLNLGNTQLVSVFTICCEIAILCESGGFCSLTNSNSSFGTFGLKADGVSLPKYYGSVAQTITAPKFGGSDILINNLVKRPNSGDALSFDGSKYYTVSTTSDVKIGKTTVENPNFTNQLSSLQIARNTIIAATDALKVDTVAYVNTTYPSLQYSQSKCARDVGILIKAATSDMVMNTNYSSIVSARSYYNGSASGLISNQLTETIAAIEFLKTEMLALLTNGTVPYIRIESNLNEIIDIVTNGIGNADTIEFNDPVGVSSAELRAKSILVLNKDFIIEEGIAYINENYPSSTYNEAVCRTDIGYIVDAITYDVLYGGNSQSLVAGQQYYFGTALQLGEDEKDSTLAVYNYIRTVTKDCLLNITVVRKNSVTTQDTSTNSSTVEMTIKTNTLYDTITGYIENGSFINDFIDNNEPDFSSQDATSLSSRQTILDNKTKISIDTIEFLNDQFSSFVYDEVLCSRDVGLIIDAVSMDVALGTNYNSVIAGLSYQRINSLKVKQDQFVQTKSAIEFVRDSLIALEVGTTATSRINLSFNEMLDIFENNNPDSITFPEPTNADSATINAKDLLQLNKDFLIAETIAFINDAFPPHIYNEEKCIRDVGLILDAVSLDVVLNSNHNSITAGLSYRRGSSAVVLANQLSQTLAAIEFVKVTILALNISSTSKIRVATLFNEITNIINTNAQSTTVNTLPINATENTLNANSQFVANKLFMQDEIDAWITVQVAENISPFTLSFTYDAAACRRDVGFIIDALIFDTLYGGNTASRVVAESYFDNAVLQLGTGQTAPTIAVFERLQTVVAQVIQKQSVVVSTGNASVQDITGDAASVNEANDATSLIQITIDIVQAGSAAGLDEKELPSITWTATTAQADYATIIGNKSSVSLLAIAEINNEIADFAFDEDKCARDVGFIVDALTYDTLYGGNTAMRTVALSYFAGRTSQLGADEVMETISAYDHLSSVITDVVQEVAISVTTGNIESQVINSTPSNAVTATGIARKLELVISVIRAGNTDSVVSKINPSIAWAPTELQSDYLEIVTSSIDTRAATIDYINTRFSKFNYNQSKCARDIKLIIQAVVDDLALDTNYKTILAGKSYYRASAAKVIGNQLSETTAAINFVKIKILELIDSSISDYSTISDSFDMLINIISNGTSVAPAINYTAPVGVNVNVEQSRDILQNNKQFIIDEGTAFISLYYPLLEYNSAKCEEDIAFIIDAITYDLLYNGNSQTIDAADEYYSGGTLQIPASQKSVTLATYARLKDVVSDCITNITVNSLQSVSVQDTSIAPATATEVIKVEELFDIVIRLVDNGYVCQVTLDETIPLDTNDIISGSSVSFHQYSLITASGHTFEWVGAGIDVNAALPYEGGRPILENQVIQQNGGRVYYTGTDQEGDFRIGDDLTINRTTGTIEGDTFDRSLFAVLTPYILAIED